MIIRRICILGGTGFVGRRLANRLTREGYELRVLTRDREKAKEHLILLPKLDLVEADVHDGGRLAGHLEGCDAVINLIGILNERRGADFNKVHVELAGKVVNACREQGIRRLLHMSALNAAPDAPSRYLRTKGEAEDLVHGAADLRVTSYRPAAMFGPGDGLYNRFATLLKLAPVFPLACAGARFAPVFVGDVAEVFARTLKDPDYHGRRLQLCGPETFTLREIVEYTADCLDLKRAILSLPDPLSRAQATMIDLGGFLFRLLGVEKPFSRDNYLSLRLDSTCPGGGDVARTGVAPTPVETVVPQYLGLVNQRSRYAVFRRGPRDRTS